LQWAQTAHELRFANKRKPVSAFCIFFPRLKISKLGKKRLLLKIFVGMSFANINSNNKHSGNIMLGWTLLFLIIALVAGVLGFSGIAGVAVGIAKILFFIFLVLFLVSLIVRLAAK
jgi:uncharacterized membrane protein YtjA (UPF0391 family)